MFHVDVVRRFGFRVVLGIAVCSFAGAWLANGSARAEKEKPAAEPDFKDELPRIPPHEPADALKAFQTLPGFRLEQVAAEPLVHSPVGSIKGATYLCSHLWEAPGAAHPSRQLNQVP